MVPTFLSDRSSSRLDLGRGFLSPAEPIYLQFSNDYGLRDGDWKLVSFKGEEWELYNVANDRTELSNLAKTEPERLNSMIKKWKDMSLNVLHSKKLAEAKMKTATDPRTNSQWTVFDDSAKPSAKTRKRAASNKATPPAATSKGNAQFSRRDKNKDGKVSCQEFIAGAKRDTDKLKAMFKK